ncbi:hypothetical protein RchiOBHm_Chr6g0263191 [Rosa chinensis]|uniref:Uncharacterized protein n=1 Tax=Rosa chinensis TaxID=74649 RepID=A0A2P6PNV3_ROSCH|nr:hypothetical protein RchiOBHm_Chr6g0263191 [Rosa chinensis]
MDDSTGSGYTIRGTLKSIKWQASRRTFSRLPGQGCVSGCSSHVFLPCSGVGCRCLCSLLSCG